MLKFKNSSEEILSLLEELVLCKDSLMRISNMKIDDELKLYLYHALFTLLDYVVNELLALEVTKGEEVC